MEHWVIRHVWPGGWAVRLCAVDRNPRVGSFYHKGLGVATDSDAKSERRWVDVPEPEINRLPS